jgi:hypothetical protein
VNSLNQKYWTETDVKQLAERYGFDGWTMPASGIETLHVSRAARPRS